MSLDPFLLRSVLPKTVPHLYTFPVKFSASPTLAVVVTRPHHLMLVEHLLYRNNFTSCVASDFPVIRDMWD